MAHSEKRGLWLVSHGAERGSPGLAPDDGVGFVAFGGSAKSPFLLKPLFSRNLFYSASIESIFVRTGVNGQLATFELTTCGTL